jgi:hypothetical protein
MKTEIEETISRLLAKIAKRGDNNPNSADMDMKMSQAVLNLTKAAETQKHMGD